MNVSDVLRHNDKSVETVASCSLRVTFSLKVLKEVASFIKIEKNSFVWLEDDAVKILLFVAEGYTNSSNLIAAFLDDPVPLQKTICSLREALQFVSKCVIAKALTHNDMMILHNNFEHFKTLWQLLFADEELIDVMLVKNLISSYDSCVKEINNLLIPSLKTNSSVKR